MAGLWNILPVAEAVAAVVSLGELAAGHGRHSPETLWGVGSYLGSYSSLTAVSDLQEKQNNQSYIMSSPFESSVENTANKGNQSEAE